MTARARRRNSGIRSHGGLHACWRTGGRAGQIFDCRDTAAGVGGLPRTVSERAGERGRDGAGTPPKLGDPVTRRVARMLARVGPHSEAISGPTAHVVAERPRIRPSQRRPGPARAPVSATAHLRSSRHFCSQWSLLKWRSRQTSNHTESRSKCMPQPVTNTWKSAQIPYMSRAFARHERSNITF